MTTPPPSIGGASFARAVEAEHHLLPRDLAWGISTSSYRIAGATKVDGGGPSIRDGYHITNGASGDIACDHYHDYADSQAGNGVALTFVKPSIAAQSNGSMATSPAPMARHRYSSKPSTCRSPA